MALAPSKISLRCGSCGCNATPCLVCAHPIAASQRKWENCSHCGVLNPLSNRARKALGFSPPQALSLSFVRRVQSALIGRRAYALSLFARTEDEIKRPQPFNLLEKQGILHLHPELHSQQNSSDQTPCPSCGLVPLQTPHPASEPGTKLELLHSDSQLLAMNCPQALADDLNNSCSSKVEFPICRNSSRCRVTAPSIDCGALQEFSGFSLKLLQLAMEMLEPELNDLKETLDQTMAATSKFLSRREALQSLQASRQMTQEALKQAGVDSTAAAAHKKIPLLGPVLAAFLSDKLEQQRESSKTEAQEFTALFYHINKILQKLFQLAADLPQLKRRDKTNATGVCAEQLLLLSHDIFHATSGYT